MSGGAAYSFATAGYYRLFGGLPSSNAAALRRATIDYIRGHDKSWFERPVCTIINGQRLTGGSLGKTVDWTGKENGAQLSATEEEFRRCIHHAHTFRPNRDYREAVRKIDRRLMTLPLAARIIGNQAMDFGKQDGVTEIVEAAQANVVEQRLNDALLEDEQRGRVAICRDPAFVGCVSNFSNFLDLSRKVMRNVELGVPVIVLSRSNTTQHMFRWFELLNDLMAEYGVDQGLITYVAVDRKMKNRLFEACPESPAYFTSSREVAQALVKQLPKTMSSTGGPNTMVATELTEKVEDAFVLSNTIENKGQCTALRHAVFPEMTADRMERMYKDVPIISSSADALEEGNFAGIFKDGNTREDEEGYQRLKSQPLIAYKIGKDLPYGIEEKWREPVVDITQNALATTEDRHALAKWLNTEQPISLAMNCDVDLARQLFETTGIVVYTVGNATDKPALTCQAEPQNGECFGEFPPRRQLQEFTHLPVIIPSSTPGYNSYYTQHYLQEKAREALPDGLEYAEPLLEGLSAEVRGYCHLIVEYLNDASGPKIGGAGRTALFGVQRPPMLEESPSVLRADAGATMDGLLPSLLPFLVCNARSGLQLSVDPALEASLRARLEAAGVGEVQVRAEDAKAFEQRIETFTPYNVIRPAAGRTGFESLEPLLVAHWVSRFFPMGHIKSVYQNDGDFIGKFIYSGKWMRVERRPEAAP